MTSSCNSIDATKRTCRKADHATKPDCVACVVLRNRGGCQCGRLVEELVKIVSKYPPDTCERTLGYQKKNNDDPVWDSRILFFIKIYNIFHVTNSTYAF